MTKSYKIELDEQFIDDFFSLANIPCNKEDLTLGLFQDGIIKIKKRLHNMLESKVLNESYVYSLLEEEQNEKIPPVLIVDDLGVITYQLNTLFKKIGYCPTVSKEIYDAIEKFKNNKYDLVIMDLFIPTDREGFILLDEMFKIIKVNNLKTKVGVITASGKQEHKKICLEKGAAFFMEKKDDWQTELLNLCNNNSSESLNKVINTLPENIEYLS